MITTKPWMDQRVRFFYSHICIYIYRNTLLSLSDKYTHYLQAFICLFSASIKFCFMSSRSVRREMSFGNFDAVIHIIYAIQFIVVDLLDERCKRGENLILQWLSYFILKIQIFCLRLLLKYPLLKYTDVGIMWRQKSNPFQNRIMDLINVCINLFIA